MRKYIIIGLIVCGATIAAAQTPGESANVKFVKVTSPVPKQAAVGSCAAGEFYHAQYTGAAWADYNNDGYLDVFYSDHNRHISTSTMQSNLYKNSGNGTFARVAWPPFAGTGYSTPVWADFNNDGLIDMFISGVASGGYQWNDDKTDFSTLKSHLYLNTGIQDGNATYTEVENCGVRPVFNALSGGKGHMAAAAGDIDKDGYTDLLLCGFDETARPGTGHPIDAVRACYLYRNVGGERFELVENPVDGTQPFAGLCDGSVTLCDLDGDSWLDIVANGYDLKHESSLHIYYNNGDGTFTEGQHNIKGLTAGITTIADLNNDGMPDLVMGGIHENTNLKQLFVVRNMGERSWERIDIEAFEGIDGAQISAGDVNQDGLVDLLVGGHGSAHEHTTWLYVNQGGFNFVATNAHYQDPFGKLGHFNRVTHGNQHLIDFDNDGFLDAWITGWCNGTCGNGCLTEIYRNNSASKGVAANESPATPTALQASLNANMATFTWAAPVDDFTPEAALRYNFYIKRQGSDKAFMVLPADISTGFLRVGNVTASIYGPQFAFPIKESGTYEWGVQAIDNGNKGSKWSSATSTFEVSGINDIHTSAITSKVWASGNALYYTTTEPCHMSIYRLDGTLSHTISASEAGMVTIDDAGAYIVVTRGNKSINKTKVIITQR